MSPVNYRTYQLLKENKIIMETESATFDRAVDYFCDIYPQAYSDPSYSFRMTKMSHER